MKFVNPELEVVKFNVEDILTASGEGPIETEPEPISQAGYAMEGSCVGNASDNYVPNCAV